MALACLCGMSLLVPSLCWSFYLTLETVLHLLILQKLHLAYLALHHSFFFLAHLFLNLVFPQLGKLAQHIHGRVIKMLSVSQPSLSSVVGCPSRSVLCPFFSRIFLPSLVSLATTPRLLVAHLAFAVAPGCLKNLNMAEAKCL